MAYLDSIGELLAYAIILPLIGLVVVVGGHTVGVLLENSRVGPLHKYGLLTGLGFITYVIYGALLGSSS